MSQTQETHPECSSSTTPTELDAPAKAAKEEVEGRGPRCATNPSNRGIRGLRRTSKADDPGLVTLKIKVKS